MEKKKAPWFYYVVRWLVWLFSPKFRIVGEENLPEGACVIVGNHCHAYGPIAAELYTPGLHYTWCTGEMMERGEVADYAFRDFWSMKPKWTLWFFRLLSHAIVPLSLLVFRNAYTIPVYHDSRILTTFRQTGQHVDVHVCALGFAHRFRLGLRGGGRGVSAAGSHQKYQY